MRIKIYSLATLGLLFLATSATHASVKLTAKEQSVLNEVNQQRKKAGLQPLTVSSQLTHAARAQAIAMAQHKSGANVLDGKGPEDRIKIAGYKGYYIGDNLAYGFSTSVAVMKFWMGVARAKDLILNTNAKEVGIGDHVSNGKCYWAMYVGEHEVSSGPATGSNSKPGTTTTNPGTTNSKPGTTTTNPGTTSDLNAKVLAFAQANLGKKIGDGQCWALVDQALAAAGAKRPGTGGLGTYQFGQAVSASTNPPAALMKPGDIIQFEGVKVVDGNSWNEFPHHTAIVQSVQGNVVTMLNQNVNGQQFVQTTTIDFSKVTQGTYQAYHPQPK